MLQPIIALDGQQDFATVLLRQIQIEQDDVGSGRG